MSENRVEALYRNLKKMAVDFRIRPGERINEVALARELDASRTPLREALNRLVAEQLIAFQPGKGFHCRTLDPQAIFALYEMREVLEEAAVRLACKRASDADLAALRDSFEADGLSYEGKSIREVTAFDEAFHIGIARLAGNDELVRQLENINERIRFIRCIDIANRAPVTIGHHKKLMAALMARDADEAARIMLAHISKHMDEIVASVKEGYSSIYMPGSDDILDRSLEPLSA